MNREVLAKDSSTGRDGLGRDGLGRAGRGRVGKDVPLTTSTALRAAEDDAERRGAQAAVVAAYSRAARESLVPIVGRAKAMIAGQAGQLLDDGWPLEAILRAVDRFARRRRYAGHLAQWCRENAMDERESEHFARKDSDRKTIKTTMRTLGTAMRDAGL